ncbi:hypothetical protein ACFOD0_02630 [Shewanella intestini]|uniref:ATP-binding protein n=1 Tax=Shewanella intestini TaxID=2017544 RepID=A0ABS5I152_9GAMM|nr:MULTISPECIES: hypothetical protein [Shewanella]MBR9727747.1 hypothetical protein [Shewanella intestini]MRG36260.1 hypothetical protein [Shewanella sp. XMDDZSB0408]
MDNQIFESMVSIRSQSSGTKPHVGLGLYIARLIYRFHDGDIKAENVIIDNLSGVELCVSLPLTDKPLF